MKRFYNLTKGGKSRFSEILSESGIRFSECFPNRYDSYCGLQKDIVTLHRQSVRTAVDKAIFDLLIQPPTLKAGGIKERKKETKNNKT